MPCCDGWTDTPDDNESYGECPSCGEVVIVNNNNDSEFCAANGCNYSPTTCQQCGARPCDLSC